MATSVWSYKVVAYGVTEGGTTITYDILKDSVVQTTKTATFSSGKAETFIKRTLQKEVLKYRSNTLNSEWLEDIVDDEVIVLKKKD